MRSLLNALQVLAGTLVMAVVPAEADPDDVVTVDPAFITLVGLAIFQLACAVLACFLCA